MFVEILISLKFVLASCFYRAHSIKDHEVIWFKFILSLSDV